MSAVPVFYTILASRVHDMKNSLGMFMNTLDELADTLDGVDKEKTAIYADLQQQTSSVNNNLMQLLALYKIDNHNYPLMIDEYSVYELLHDQTLHYATLAQRKEIQLTISCDEHLLWHFDEHLVFGVINDSLGNALRYTHDQIRLSARIQAHELIICIEDNGPGFPADLLKQLKPEIRIDFSNARTGLGLYFCSVVANMHANEDKKGYIKIDNNSILGGGRFQLCIP